MTWLRLFHKKTHTKEGMSKPGILYRLSWRSFHESTEIQHIIDIGDVANSIADDDEAAVYDLVPSGVPATVSVIDNSENPFNVINSKQLTIRFRNTVSYNLNTFATGEDGRWLVNYYMDDGAGGNSRVVFKGFLVLDDISEPLLPYGAEEVVLTATDGLGLLKDIPLTDFDGNVPVGKYKISEILAMALSKTGLDLESRVSFNIKLDGDTDDISTATLVEEHLFSRVYLDMFTFQDEVNTKINCYEVIQKILGFEARLFQMKGQWWILRVDEVEDTAIRSLYITSFDEVGTFIGNLGGKLFVKEIDKDEDIKFAEDSTSVKLTRPHVSVRLNFNYDQPIVPYNANFEIGDLNNTVSATEKWYNVDGWFIAKGFPSGANAFSVYVPTSTTYIKRSFDSYTRETGRFAVITSPASQDAITNKLVSQGIPVKQGDRFNISVDFKWENNLTGSSRYYNILNVALKATDGTWYLHGRDEAGNSADPIWYDTSAWSANTNKGQQLFVFDDQNESEWISQATEVKPMPENGTLYIWLNSMNTNADADDDIDIYYSNLSVEYVPLIAESYRELNGQYFRTYQTPSYSTLKAKIEDDVFMADSPREILRGAMFKTDSEDTIFSGSVAFANGNSFGITGFYVDRFFIGQILRIADTTSNNMTTRVTGVSYSIILSSTLVAVEGTTVSETDATTNIYSPVFSLCDGFYNAAVFPTGPPDSTYVHPYGHIQLFDVWNQYKNEMRVLQASLQGLDLGLLDSNNLPDHADMINKWSCTDSSLHLNNKWFLLLNYEQNHDLQNWTATFREVYNLNRSKDYSNLEFKYIER